MLDAPLVSPTLHPRLPDTCAPYCFGSPPSQTFLGVLQAIGSTHPQMLHDQAGPIAGRTTWAIGCSQIMESIKTLVGRLFTSRAPAKASLYHGPLLRSEAFQEERLQARGTPGYRALRQATHQAWLAARRGSEGPMHMFCSAHATGVLFLRDRATPDRSFRQLLDDMAELVAGLGYKQQLADTRVDEAGIQRDRIYMKPWPLGAEPPLQQRYGNINLEQWGPVGRVQGMKVLVTIYQDRLYAPAAEASELFDVLFPG